MFMIISPCFIRFCCQNIIDAHNKLLIHHVHFIRKPLEQLSVYDWLLNIVVKDIVPKEAVLGMYRISTVRVE